MKLDTLISHLQTIKEKHGNITVVVYGGVGGSYYGLLDPPCATEMKKDLPNQVYKVNASESDTTVCVLNWL
jgi:hypothetical protein